MRIEPPHPTVYASVLLKEAVPRPWNAFYPSLAASRLSRHGLPCWALTPGWVEGTSVEGWGAWAFPLLSLPWLSPCRVVTQGVKPENNAGLTSPSHVPARDVTKPRQAINKRRYSGYGRGSGVQAAQVHRFVDMDSKRGSGCCWCISGLLDPHDGVQRARKNNPSHRISYPNFGYSYHLYRNGTQKRTLNRT